MTFFLNYWLCLLLLTARKHINECFQGTCKCKVLTILVANDNSLQLNRNQSRNVSTASSDHAQPQAPELDAKKACDLLKPVLEDCGFGVLELVNRSKGYLLALIKVLCDENILESCEQVIFISTTHGRRDEFCMNDEYVKFEDLIHEVTNIEVEYFMFCFECCQIDGKSLTVSKVNKQHIVIYSVPPERISYHYKGVGLLIICLTELLKRPYTKSLNDLDRELRSDYCDRLVEVLKISEEGRGVFLKEHAPLHVGNMHDDVNLYEIIRKASELSLIV